jgi:acyl dehydratase
MTTTLTIADLEQAKDLDLGASDWVTITQEEINKFADATGDHQWIHVDDERAKAGPFGSTIAHGYLTVSLLPVLLADLLVISDVTMGVNYGIDRLRLTSPVPAGSRVRARAKVIDAERKGDGVLYRVEVTVEIEGSERPALVGTVVYLVYP